MPGLRRGGAGPQLRLGGPSLLDVRLGGAGPAPRVPQLVPEVGVLRLERRQLVPVPTPGPVQGLGGLVELAAQLVELARRLLLASGEPAERRATGRGDDIGPAVRSHEVGDGREVDRVCRRQRGTGVERTGQVRHLVAHVGGDPGTEVLVEVEHSRDLAGGELGPPCGRERRHPDQRRGDLVTGQPPE